MVHFFVKGSPIPHFQIVKLKACHFRTATEIKEEAELFLPATFNRAKFEKDLDRYIDSIAGFGFLVEAKHIEGEKRYKIHRIIKDKVTLDDILEFKNKLNDYNAADEPI